jgi:hypothetical protein
MNVNCGSSVQYQVPDHKVKYFRDAGAGVIEGGEESPIPLPDPGVGVGGVEDSLDFFAREKLRQRTVESFHGHGQSMLNAVKCGEVVMSCVLQKGAQRCQTCVATAHRVLSLGFQMVQEGQDEVRVEIGEQEMLGLSSQRLFGKSKQQAKRVSISGNSSRAHRSMLLQMFYKESL